MRRLIYTNLRCDVVAGPTTAFRQKFFTIFYLFKNFRVITLIIYSTFCISRRAGQPYRSTLLRLLSQFMYNFTTYRAVDI